MVFFPQPSLLYCFFAWSVLFYVMSTSVRLFFSFCKEVYFFSLNHTMPICVQLQNGFQPSQWERVVAYLPCEHID